MAVHTCLQAETTGYTYRDTRKLLFCPWKPSPVICLSCVTWPPATDTLPPRCNAVCVHLVRVLLDNISCGNVSCAMPSLVHDA
jgi:hypothetical protein